MKRLDYSTLTEAERRAFLASSEKLFKRQVRKRILVARVQRFPMTRFLVAVAGVFTIGDPPRIAQFVLLLVPKRSREHLLGDLEEEYRSVLLPEYGGFWARVWYWEQIALAIGEYLWPFVKRVLGLAAIWKVIGR